MDNNTSKVRIAADPSVAATTLMNASGAGSSLFVINLCASQAPVPNVGKSLPGHESYRLYQVARREDGRTRYRLRLGFFTSEADAEAVLSTVRSSYPTAFTTCLCEEDRKFTRGFVAEPSAPPAAPKIAVVQNNAPKPASVSTPPRPQPAPAAAAKPVAKPAAPSLAAPAPKPAAPPVAAPATKAVAPKAAAAAVKAATPAPTPAAPVPKAAAPQPAAKPQPMNATPAAAKPAPQPKAAPSQHTIEAPSKLRAAIELTLESEPTPAPKQPSAAAPSNEPFRVSRGVDIPTTSLSLESTGITAPAAAKAAPTAPAKPTPQPAARTPAADASKMKAAHATAPTAIKDAARNPGAKLPELDSTQTIRALTTDELQDESQEKWFAIQLAVSDQPVNLDTMPRLDIFEAYRLYSVASAGSGKITHSLRIGFFREEVSAEAVCGYLTTFFNSPSVVRISIAEQARFKDAPTPKLPPKAEVLDLSHARERAPKAIPTVTMEVATPRVDPGATGSFKVSSTGVHKALSTGAHNALTSTGMHRALGATGAHPTFKAASKSAPAPTKRSAPVSKTGKHKALQSKKSLSEQLLEEAREVELSQSGIRKLPKNDSLLSKMFGKLTKS